MSQLQEFLNGIEPLLTLLSAILSVTVIGFVIGLALFMKQALSAKNDVTEERRKKEQEDRLRAERERDQFKAQLDAILDGANVTVESLVANPSLDNITQEVTKAVQEALRSLHQIETRPDATEKSAEEYLELAKASTIACDWRSAASYYDKYVREFPDNWEIHFLRAVAYANMRAGRDSETAALRAYGDAIALAPEYLDANMRARLHTYRGAILKRLRRLEEALSELLLAQKWAYEPEEVADNLYNLACVYSMMGDKQSMMPVLRKLLADARWTEIIRGAPYFGNFRRDDDFLDLLD